MAKGAFQIATRDTESQTAKISKTAKKNNFRFTGFINYLKSTMVTEIVRNSHFACASHRR